MGAPLENASLDEKAVIGERMAISFFVILVLAGGMEFIGYTWEKDLSQGPNGWPLVASRRIRMKLVDDSEDPYYVLEPGSQYAWNYIPVRI